MGKANGRIIRWRALVFSSGLITDAMKENTSMIRKKARVSFSGLTVVNMTASGRMESSTEKAPTPTTKACLEKENGLKERESHGRRMRKPVSTHLPSTEKH